MSARLQAAAAVIESEPGFSVGPLGLRLLSHAEEDALVAALAVPGTAVLWPATKRCRSTTPAATILTEVVKSDPLLAEVDRRVWWSRQKRLALRLYAAIFDDDTVALWTTPQPRAPRWPVPTPAELQHLHAQAQRADTAPPFVVMRRAPVRASWDRRRAAAQSVGV